MGREISVWQFGGIFLSVVVLCSIAGCGRHTDTAAQLTNAPILLFNGKGTSPNDVAAIESILKENQLEYSTVSSAQLNRMGEEELRGHRLLIVPGGNFIKIGEGLTAAAIANVRSAVSNGMNYHGICAGAFFASDSGYPSLNLTEGVRFKFYSAEDRGIHKAAVAIAVPAGPTLEQYWEDGPQLTGWGEAVAKYPDGTPAVAQGNFGKGWMVLSGFHAEAPAGWRGGMIFSTPVSADNDFALMLIRATLNRSELPHFK